MHLAVHKKRNVCGTGGVGHKHSRKMEEWGGVEGGTRTHDIQNHNLTL